MNERDYQRKAYFPQLAQNLAELIGRLGRLAGETFLDRLEERSRSEAAD